MSINFNEFEGILDFSMCRTELKDYENCFVKASNVKKREKCKEMFKTYQFCLAKVESERLNQGQSWESFKEKWGHYPNEKK